MASPTLPEVLITALPQSVTSAHHLPDVEPDARALREELKRSAAEHAETRAELAEAKLEIERLRDAVS